MKKIIATLMIICSIGTANAYTPISYISHTPQRPHYYGVRILPEYESRYRYYNNNDNHNNEMKALATVAIAVGIIAILYNNQTSYDSYKLEESKYNSGHVVITRF